MLDVQNSVVNLLCEIDEICRRAGIEYSLAGRALAAAVNSGNWENEDYLAEVMMTPDNYGKFVAATMDRINDRVIETLQNNNKMDGVYARYVNLNSTLIDVTRGSHYMYQGVAVIIRILRSKAPSSKLAKLQEEMIVMNGSNPEDIIKYAPGKKTVMKARGLVAARKLMGSPAKMKKFFNDNVVDTGNGKLFYCDTNGKHQLSRKLFSNYTDIEFCGKTLRSIAKPGDYLKKLYGDNLAAAARATDYPAEEWGVYYDVDTPFHEVLEDASKMGWNLGVAAKEKSDYDAFSKWVYKKSLSEADKQFTYVWRTINRFRLNEELGSRKQEIKSLYGAGKFDQVKSILAEFIELLETYAKKDMGFSFDAELFDIACAIMDRDGKGKQVKKIRSLLPEEYKEDLNDYLKREGYSND